ncbi:MAG: CopG family transcriptional regulator [Defluviitaleaceae bacterium]|nr:CopG family transcriptional regulator [Defluviitaleaceae bacterium]
MENKVAVVSIMVKDTEKATEINQVLHTFSDKIIARLGLPCGNQCSIVRKTIISVIVEATKEDIQTLSAKLEAIESVSVKKVCWED